MEGLHEVRNMHNLCSFTESPCQGMILPVDTTTTLWSLLQFTPYTTIYRTWEQELVFSSRNWFFANSFKRRLWHNTQTCEEVSKSRSWGDLNRNSRVLKNKGPVFLTGLMFVAVLSWCNCSWLPVCSGATGLPFSKMTTNLCVFDMRSERYRGV